MQTLIKCIIILFFFLATNSAFTAQHTTAAKQALLIDASTGQVLFQHNAAELMHPSSMTKIMTTYLLFEALQSGQLSLTDRLTVSEKAWKMQGSRMFLNYGDKPTVDELLKGIIVQSGNDACVAVAEGLSGSEDAFVDKMNMTAKKLGMTQTHFMNASGWPDPRNLSTAKDLGKLAMALIRDFPGYYNYHKIEKFLYGNISQSNRNTLIGKLGVDGIKTGHTEAGGYGVVLSALNKDMRLIAVINGLVSEKMRAQEGEMILNYGFKSFENLYLFKSSDVIVKPKVLYGKSPTVALTVNKDFKVLVANEKDKVKCEAIYKEKIMAPIKPREKLGTLRCNIPNIFSDFLEVSLVAAHNVPEANFVQRIWQNIEYILESV